MEVDEATPRKLESAMELDFMEQTTPLPITPQKVSSNVESLLNDDFIHLTLFKILNVSLKPSDNNKGGLVLSDVDPHHPILSSATQLGSSTAADLIMESLDLIISGNKLANSLFEPGSPITCLHYLVDCMFY